MKCNSCGFANRKGIIYCENCGEKLKLPTEKPTPVAGKTCPKCGEKVKTGVKFCENCGAKIPQAKEAASARGPKFCPECGTAVRAGTKFCENCGTALGMAITGRGKGLSEAEDVGRKEPRRVSPWRRALSIGMGAVALLLVLGFWTQALPVKAIPYSSSPLLAEASGNLAAFQANLPRPAVVENIVGNIHANRAAKMKGDAGEAVNGGAAAGVEGFPTIAGCEMLEDLSITNVTEMHFFSENSALASSRLIYTLESSSQQLNNYLYGFHTVWYVAQAGENINAVAGKQYTCSSDPGGKISCNAPDWRGADSAIMSVFSDDPACPLPLAVFRFNGDYVYPTDEKKNLCTPIDFGLPEVTVPENSGSDEKVVNYCFNTSPNLPPSTGYNDDFIMSTRIGNTYYTIFPTRESTRRICYRFTEEDIPSNGSFTWKVYDFRCWSDAVAGTTTMNDNYATTTVDGQVIASGVTNPTSLGCEAAPGIQSADVRYLRQYGPEDSPIYVYEIVLTLDGTLPDWDDSTNRYMLTTYVKRIEAYNGGYNTCVLNDTRTKITCNDVTFNKNDPGLYKVKFWNESGFNILCEKEVYVGSVSLPVSASEASNSTDHCNVIGTPETTTTILGWQPDGTFLVYFKIPGGVPGVTLDVPGDTTPFEYIAGLGEIQDFENTTCYIDGFDDRFYCKFPASVSRWIGQSVSVWLNETNCFTVTDYSFIMPATVEVIEPPDSAPTGCGPEPDSASTDPDVVKKYHQWCTCKGGVWTWDNPEHTTGWCSIG